MSPLFDLTQLTNFADDNFYVAWNTDLGVLVINLEKKLEMITKWLRDSGLVVNESKTEVCLFHKNDPPKVSIKLLGSTIHSKKEMNVLGVTFDSKLTWTPHIVNCINKAKKAFFCVETYPQIFQSKRNENTP